MKSSFPSLYFTKLVLQQKYHIIWPLSIFFNLLPVFQTFKIFFKSFLLWLIFGFHKFFLSSTPRNNFDILLKFIHYYYLRLKFDRFKLLNIFFSEIFILSKNYRFFTNLPSVDRQAKMTKAPTSMAIATGTTTSELAKKSLK